MKGAIIYSSKTGTTKKCAEFISQKTEFTLFDLRDKSFKKQFDFWKYDYIVLGAPFRMGMLDKPMKKFLKKYGNLLLDVNFAVFGVGISNNAFGQMNKYYDNLIEESKCSVWLGGAIVTEGIKGISASITKAVIAQYQTNNQPLPVINQADLEKLCDKILDEEKEIIFDTDLKKQRAKYLADEKIEDDEEIFGEDEDSEEEWEDAGWEDGGEWKATDGEAEELSDSDEEDDEDEDEDDDE